MKEWAYSYRHTGCESCQNLAERARDFAIVRGSVSSTYSEDKVSYSVDMKTRTVSEEHSATATRKEN